MRRVSGMLDLSRMLTVVQTPRTPAPHRVRAHCMGTCVPAVELPYAQHSEPVAMSHGVRHTHTRTRACEASRNTGVR